MFNLRKFLVRIAVGLVMASILGYIFWPESNTSDKTNNNSTLEPTATSVAISDPPCLVLYQKDKSTTVLESTPCLSVYVEKYNNLYYKSLNIVCRSSGDGKAINRNSLSEKRMEALQFDLMKMGIKFEDIKATSIGDQSPYPGVDPQSEDGKILNRSCEITGNK